MCEAVMAGRGPYVLCNLATISCAPKSSIFEETSYASHRDQTEIRPRNWGRGWSKLNILLKFTGRLEELLVILISVVRDYTEIDPRSEIDTRSEIDPRSTSKFGQYSPKLLVGRRNFSRPPTRHLSSVASPCVSEGVDAFIDLGVKI